MTFDQSPGFVEATKRNLEYPSRESIRRNLEFRLSYLNPINSFENFSKRTIEDRKNKDYTPAQEFEHALKGLGLLVWNLVPRIGLILGTIYVTYKGIELLS